MNEVELFVKSRKTTGWEKYVSSDREAHISEIRTTYISPTYEFGHYNIELHQILKDNINQNIKQFSEISRVHISANEFSDYNPESYQILREEFDKHIKQVNNFVDALKIKLNDEPEQQVISGLHLYKIIENNQPTFLNYFERFLRQNQEIEKINIKSFINYLYISISKKLNNSYDIAVDEYGRIVIYYSENKKNRGSKKISIIVNENDFVISILSRKNGLAKLSGVCTLKYPDGYYKFDSALRALL